MELTEAQQRRRVDAVGKARRGQAPLIRILGRCEEVGECWEFRGSVNRDGYGMARLDGRMQGAHRIVFMAINGPLPSSVCVCHHCDNPPCCNPAHLFTGTKGDNNRDRQRKGRTRGLLPAGGRIGRRTMVSQ